MKEVRATFTVPPGIDAARPATSFAVAELRAGRGLDSDGLALDDGERGAERASWLRKPSALPSASPRQILNPDLKPRGLMRFFR